MQGNRDLSLIAADRQKYLKKDGHDMVNPDQQNGGIGKANLTLSINGIQVVARQGMTIFNAARAAGFAIPHLCYHPKISVIGSCRLCVVEVEGARNLPASCSTPVAEGMVIQTESTRVIEARKVILHLLLANHPEDCLTCEKTGDCRLQAFAYMYGVRKAKYAGDVKHYPADDTNPFFIRDHNKCILCGRCVYQCAENVGVNVYDYGYRGFDAKIVAGMDRAQENSPCVFCGNCITVCPTGALQPKQAVGQGRVFDLDKVQTVCPYCGVGCALTLQINNGKITGVVPANGPANRNLLCVKGRFGWEFIQHPGRLTDPLIKENGQFREATWEESLDLVARRITEIKESHGADSLAAMSSAKCTNEENYLMQKLIRAVWGTNNIDNSARLCHASTIAGLSEAFGSGAATNSIAELEEADTIFIIGSNTMEAHPVIGMLVQKAHRRGTKIILVDPRRIDMAEMADIHLQHLPGTDVALLNGLMHIILREKLHDKDFIADRTEGFADLETVLEKYTPENVEKITGVPTEKLVEAARLYAGSSRATILYAMGITQHIRGTDNVHSVANLAMLTGNVGRASTGVYPLRGQNNVQGACDMGALPNYLPGYQRVANDDARDKFGRTWGAKLPENIGLTEVEMLEGALDGRVRGMYIMGENPMLSNPDLSRVEASLRKLDFLVVQDIFLTETAQLAHVVLPGCSFAEKDGTFSNTERRIQRVRPAIPPVGQSKPDWEIICQVSERLGYPMPFRSPAEIMVEIASVTPIYGGISYERLGEEGIQWPCPHQEHPGTKFLHHERFSGGLGKFAAIEFDPPAEWPDPEYPYLLITGRHLYHYHTGSMTRRCESLEKFRPDPYVEVHPATAASLDIQQGEMITVASRRGSIDIPAFITERVHPRQVFIPFHYIEAAANELTHVSLDPESKIPELKVSAVKLNRFTSPGKEHEQQLGISARIMAKAETASSLGGKLKAEESSGRHLALSEPGWPDEDARNRLDAFIKKHHREPGSLIPILQEVQRSLGYISPEVMAYLARKLRRPMAEVYGVASFYAQFYLEPRGENMVRVCMGTACHVRGGREILAAACSHLGIKPGETSPDKKFSLEQVACLGACGLAPVMMINGDTLGRLTPDKVGEALSEGGNIGGRARE